jgi:hypothetical protein
MNLFLIRIEPNDDYVPQGVHFLCTNTHKLMVKEHVILSVTIHDALARGFSLISIHQQLLIS